MGPILFSTSASPFEKVLQHFSFCPVPVTFNPRSAFIFFTLYPCYSHVPPYRSLILIFCDTLSPVTESQGIPPTNRRHNEDRRHVKDCFLMSPSSLRTKYPDILAKMSRNEKRTFKEKNRFPMYA